MDTGRREFLQAAAATTAAIGAIAVTHDAAAEDAAVRVKNIKAFAFDAYGTLFDVFSVTQLCEQLFPGRGNAVAQVWRAKQLQYSLLRRLMGRHRDFWGLTEDGVVFATKSLNLDLTPAKRKHLMDSDLSLAAFAGVNPRLEALT